VDKIIKIVFIIILFLILLNLYLGKGKSPLENKFPLSIFQIKSGSMKPEIEINEIVVLWKCKNYKLNDVITYQSDSSYFITHRIIQTTKDGYITKGDYNNTKDEQKVTNDKIKGKVIFHSKILGKIYQYRYYLIIILVLLLFI